MTSLSNILSHMAEMEQEIIEFKPEDHALLFEAAKEKIDKYKEFIDALESEADRKKAYAKEFERSAETLTNLSERLKKSLVFSLAQANMPSIKGDKWQVDLRRRRKVEIPLPPTTQDFLRSPELVNVRYGWCEKSPSAETANKLIASGIDAGIIDTVFEWNKEKLKESLDQDPEKVKELAFYGETTYVQFSPKKETKR